MSCCYSYFCLLCFSFVHVYVSVRYICFFFFKQKTAYEMRISDWSSDVCSSDLARRRGYPRSWFRHPVDPRQPRLLRGAVGGRRLQSGAPARRPGCRGGGAPRQAHPGQGPGAGALPLRSEEHTSELQSLMRSSYAVFCLNKKKKTNNQQNNRH